jgi:hypothetical protein
MTFLASRTCDDSRIQDPFLNFQCVLDQFKLSAAPNQRSELLDAEFPID